MRHAAGGFDPDSRYATSWRWSVTGSPGVLGVVVMLGGTPAMSSPKRTAAPIRWRCGRVQSTRTGAAPIAGDRLDHRQGGERRRIGAQHPGAEPDAGNKGEFAQSVKLGIGEAAFG